MILSPATALMTTPWAVLAIVSLPFVAVTTPLVELLITMQPSIKFKSRLFANLRVSEPAVAPLPTLIITSSPSNLLEKSP